MNQDFKTGHFLIRKDTAKNAGSAANFIDRQALFNFWDQKLYQDVTDRLRQKTIMNNDMQEYATPFTDFLKNNNRRMSVTSDKIRYSKTATTPMHWRLMKTVTGTPGVRGENFEVVLDTNVLKPGSKIAPEEGFQYMLVVQSLPRITGDGWTYTVRNIDPNRDTYFPLQYLREGTRWVKRGSTNVSEGSSQWGETIWEKGRAVLTWEVGFFKTGKECRITDEALSHVFTLDPCDAKGKPVENMPKTFLTEMELNFRMEIEKEMEEDLLWSQYTRDIPDTSTRLARQIGAGIFDFYKDGNIYDYNPTLENSSIRELVDFQNDIWYNNFGTVVYGTGRPGLELADQWIKREYGEITVIRDYEHYIERTGNVVPGGAEAWKLKKPMFNAYELPVGGVIEFQLWPWLDDRSRRGKKHPVTGRPLLGYHFIGSRYTGTGPDSNIVLVQREGYEKWGYDPGATGLYGVGNGGKNLHTSGQRIATLRHENAYGVWVEDVSDFIWFRPNV